MVTTVGPAVGAKAQFGFSEESKWGYPTSPPTDFFEFTSEGITSEFTNLVSAALRADRAVHKQRIGTEAAGGDVNFELGPEGLGTMLKHGLGKKRTKRTDIAMILVYTGVGAPKITVDADGIEATLASTFNIAFGNGRTCNSLMTAIDNETDWTVYAPWGDGSSTGYFVNTTKTNADTTCGTADYGYTHNVSSSAGIGYLEHITDILTVISHTDHKVFFPIYYKYGIYEHTIETYQDLPEVTEGLTIEVGRDVAAFNYYGAKINSLAINATPGEIVTGTANFMAKGASTPGDPAADGANTGWALDIIDIYYAGTSSDTIQIEFSTSLEIFTMTDNANKYYAFSVEHPTHDHDGYYYDVTTIAGLIEFLQCCGQFSLTKKAGVDYSAATTGIATLGAATITTGTAATLLTAVDTSAVPLFRGDYIGTDSGTSSNVYVKISTTGALDGTGAFTGSIDDSNYSSATSITYNVWYDILDGDDADTGFDVMWPQNKNVDADDKWTIATFKDETSGATYTSIDPFVGAEGAVTLDDAAQTVMGLSFTINNNLFGDKYEMGDKQRAALKEQQMAVEGTINLEFDNLDMYRKFVNGIACDMTFTFTGGDYITSDDDVVSDTKYSLSLRFPNLKYSGSTPLAGGPDIIVTDYPFVALYDDTNSIPNVRIVMTNHVSYI